MLSAGQNVSQQQSVSAVGFQAGTRQGFFRLWFVFFCEMSLFKKNVGSPDCTVDN